MCKTFLTYVHVSTYSILFCLANFTNKLLLGRLTQWWGEINLIGQFFLVCSPLSCQNDNKNEKSSPGLSIFLVFKAKGRLEGQNLIKCLSSIACTI